jgi:hypothetical protein
MYYFRVRAGRSFSAFALNFIDGEGATGPGCFGEIIPHFPGPGPRAIFLASFVLLWGKMGLQGGRR